MIQALLLFSNARAEDCAPLDPTDLRARVDEARVAVDRDDLVSFAEVRRALFRDLPCLSAPLSSEVWARFLLDEAVVAHALGEAWEDPLATALSLDPGLPRGDLPPALRDWSAGPPSAGGAALGAGEFLLDGQPLDAVPTLSGVHVVQRREDDVWTTRVLRNAPFPAEWQAETRPVPIPMPVPIPSPLPEPVGHRRHASLPLITIGSAVGVLGAAVGVGTWAIRDTVRAPDAGKGLVAANVAGWSVAAAGGVVSGLGFVVPVKGRFR